jgi:citrate/tricarballylate utilization protein
MEMDKLIEEAGRQLTICNACRYCEGYCPVFPAMEMRREFPKGDIVFISHLCHDCRACYYACMYSPPHEFAINLPQILSTIRQESYKDWSWPALFGRSFTDKRISALLAVGPVAVAIIASLMLIGPSIIFARHIGVGAFYQVVPFLAMLVPALALVFYGAAIWMTGGAQFWRDAGSKLTDTTGLNSLAEAAGDALSLKWLKGGGPGCYYPGSKPSSARRLFHSFVFYGFLSALISTTLAAIYQDVLHQLPPYALSSAPVIFGTVGGVAMVGGVFGLLAIKIKSDKIPSSTGMMSVDYSFLLILGFTSLTGMLVLILRGTRAMGTLLILHLGLVAALFVTAPYGKFVHSMYRSLALILHRAEQVRSSQGVTGH